MVIFMVFCFFFNLSFGFLPILVGGRWNSTGLTPSHEGFVTLGARQTAEFPNVSCYSGGTPQLWTPLQTQQHISDGNLASLTIKDNTGLGVTVLINFSLKVTLGFWVMGVPKPVVIYFDEDKSVHVFWQFGCSVICNYIAASTENTLMTNTYGWKAQIIAIHLSKWH